MTMNQLLSIPEEKVKISKILLHQKSNTANAKY